MSYYVAVQLQELHIKSKTFERSVALKIGCPTAETPIPLPSSVNHNNNQHSSASTISADGLSCFVQSNSTATIRFPLSQQAPLIVRRVKENDEIEIAVERFDGEREGLFGTITKNGAAPKVKSRSVSVESPIVGSGAVSTTTTRPAPLEFGDTASLTVSCTALPWDSSDVTQLLVDDLTSLRLGATLVCVTKLLEFLQGTLGGAAVVVQNPQPQPNPRVLLNKGLQRWLTQLKPFEYNSLLSMRSNNKNSQKRGGDAAAKDFNSSGGEVWRAVKQLIDSATVTDAVCNEWKALLEAAVSEVRNPPLLDAFRERFLAPRLPTTTAQQPLTGTPAAGAPSPPTDSEEAVTANDVSSPSLFGNQNLLIEIATSTITEDLKGIVTEFASDANNNNNNNNEDHAGGGGGVSLLSSSVPTALTEWSGAIGDAAKWAAPLVEAFPFGACLVQIAKVIYNGILARRELLEAGLEVGKQITLLLTVLAQEAVRNIIMEDDSCTKALKVLVRLMDECQYAIDQYAKKNKVFQFFAADRCLSVLQETKKQISASFAELHDLTSFRIMAALKQDSQANATTLTQAKTLLQALTVQVERNTDMLSKVLAHIKEIVDGKLDGATILEQIQASEARMKTIVQESIREQLNSWFESLPRSKASEMLEITHEEWTTLETRMKEVQNDQKEAMNEVKQSLQSVHQLVTGLGATVVTAIEQVAKELHEKIDKMQRDIDNLPDAIAARLNPMTAAAAELFDPKEEGALHKPTGPAVPVEVLKTRLRQAYCHRYPFLPSIMGEQLKFCADHMFTTLKLIRVPSDNLGDAREQKHENVEGTSFDSSEIISACEDSIILVEGRAGIGKTTFVTQLCRKQSYKAGFVIMVPLSALLKFVEENESKLPCSTSDTCKVSHVISARELIVLSLQGDTTNIDETRQLANQIWFSDHPIVWMVDGLDEVQRSSNRYLETFITTATTRKGRDHALHDTAHRVCQVREKDRVVLTSREERSGRYDHSNLPLFSVNAWGADEIKLFVGHYFDEAQKQAEKDGVSFNFLDLKDGVEKVLIVKKKLGEFASLPIVADMICWIAWRDKGTKKIDDLSAPTTYRESIKRLYERAAEKKKDLVSGTKFDELEALCATKAVDAMQKGVISFQIDKKEVIERELFHSGLVRSVDILDSDTPNVRFAHKSFLEYFAATHFKSDVSLLHNENYFGEVDFRRLEEHELDTFHHAVSFGAFISRSTTYLHVHVPKACKMRLRMTFERKSHYDVCDVEARWLSAHEVKEYETQRDRPFSSPYGNGHKFSGDVRTSDSFDRTCEDLRPTEANACYYLAIRLRSGPTAAVIPVTCTMYYSCDTSTTTARPIVKEKKSVVDVHDGAQGRNFFCLLAAMIKDDPKQVQQLCEFVVGRFKHRLQQIVGSHSHTARCRSKQKFNEFRSHCGADLVVELSSICFAASSPSSSTSKPSDDRFLELLAKIKESQTLGGRLKETLGTRPQSFWEWFIASCGRHGHIELLKSVKQKLTDETFYAASEPLKEALIHAIIHGHSSMEKYLTQDLKEPVQLDLDLACRVNSTAAVRSILRQRNNKETALKALTAGLRSVQVAVVEVVLEATFKVEPTLPSQTVGQYFLNDATEIAELVMEVLFAEDPFGVVAVAAGGGGEGGPAAVHTPSSPPGGEPPLQAATATATTTTSPKDNDPLFQKKLLKLCDAVATLLRTSQRGDVRVALWNALMRRLPKSPFESWHLKKRTATVEWPDGAAHSLPNDDHHQLVVKGGEALYHLRAWNWQNNALSLKSPQQPAIPQQQPPPAPSNINSADVLVPFDKDTAALLPCLFSLISTLCRSSIQAPPDAAAALFPFHWNCQDCKLEEHALEGIVQSLSPLAVVTSLDLSKNKVIGTEAGAEAFARALGAPSSVDEYQRALSFGHCYPHNDRLKALKLSHCPMSYNALRVYEASLPVMFPCLQRLNLSGAQLASAKCLSTIARFLGAWSLSLQELVLSNLMGSSTNKPTDATNRCWMELIRVIINLPMLETLDLSGNAIPFTARTALFSAMCSDEESKILPRLTRLHVAAATQQQQVERNDLQELRVNRPALTLIED